MDGVLIVNKPQGYTSRDIVNIISKKVNTKKVGHTGTLDPLATGVLVVCIGKYTKLVDILTTTTKEYVAEIILGTNTDTLDITGQVLNDEKCIIEKEKIKKVLEEFIGGYNQEVPIYSAVKVNGKKLYEYKRNNKEVILPKRDVNIHSIKLLNTIYENNKTIIKIQTKVSKGTYIRSLARDIGLRLNTYGCMKSLNRIKQGNFTIENSYTLDNINENNFKLLKLEDIVDYKIVNLDSNLEKKVANGVWIENIYNEEYVIFKNENITCIYKNDNGILKMYKKL